MNGSERGAAPDYGRPGMLTGDIGVHCAIAELARSVNAEARPRPEEVLERFTVLAPTHIHPVEHASVMVGSRNRGLRPSAASGAVAHVLDTIQSEMVEGPAWEAVHDRRTIRVDDLAAEGRWPRFTAAVLAQTPIRSMLCYLLYTDTQDFGVLSLHANHSLAFDGEVEESGLVLASHAALTLQAIHRGRHFRSALGSRDIIGQAKGILMERYDIGAGAAFSLLSRLSQESDKPIVVIAKEVVDDKSSPRH
jgi:transcriptional regulator with GAF, ATPase, and Fis domain